MRLQDGMFPRRRLLRWGPGCSVGRRTLIEPHEEGNRSRQEECCFLMRYRAAAMALYTVPIGKDPASFSGEGMCMSGRITMDSAGAIPSGRGRRPER